MAWEQEEIRVAVDGPFGADAGDSISLSRRPGAGSVSSLAGPAAEASGNLIDVHRQRNRTHEFGSVWEARSAIR